MNKIGKYTVVMFIWVALTGVLACGEKAPPVAQAPAVSQKIATQQPPPAASATAPKDAAATAPEGVAPQPATAAPGDGAAAQKASGSEEASALIEASLKEASSYNPEGRFDPFEPLFKEEAAAPEVVTPKNKRDKRIPQTPLERVALSQLKLSAIMRTSKGNRAIVEDATGKGYVIQKGTYIGLNSGQVVLIDKNRVVVEEEIENVLGELNIQSTELKLQKPAGEL